MPAEYPCAHMPMHPLCATKSGHGPALPIYSLCASTHRATVPVPSQGVGQRAYCHRPTVCTKHDNAEPHPQTISMQYSSH